MRDVRLFTVCFVLGLVGCNGAGSGPPLVVTPVSATAPTHGSLTFVASAGTPPYSYTLSANPSGGAVDASGHYTAGDRGAVTDVLTVADAAGQTVAASITVRDGLFLTPDHATVKLFNSVAFTASGGSGAGYRFQVTSMPALGSVDAKGLYTADRDRAGDDVVTCTDSRGRTATATVHVIGPLALAPLFSSVKPGDPLSFTATGGHGALAFSLATNASGGSITADGHYVAGAHTGSDVVRVTDADGATGEATAYVLGAPDGQFTSAPHSTESVADLGGGSLTRPVLVGIHWSNDPLRTQISAFGQYIMSSPWLAQVGAEYGVVGGTWLDVPVAATAPLSFSDGEAQQQISDWIDDGTLPKNTSGQLIYMLFIPASTAYVDNGVNLCKYSGGGYHNESSASDGTPIAYAIVSPCPDQGLSQRQVIEFAGSHELIETITDAFWQSAPGFRVPERTDPWELLGAEVGDLCTYIPPVNIDGHTLTEVFSNAAAKAGGSPCVPSPARYFTASVSPQLMQPVAAGQSATFTLTGWSTSDVGAWMLFADPYGPAGGYRPFTPEIKLSQMTLGNGEQATLTVTVPQGTPRNSGTFVFVGSYFSQSDSIGALAGVYVP